MHLPVRTSVKNITTISSSHLNSNSSYGQLSRPFQISPFLPEVLGFHFDSLSEPGSKGIEMSLESFGLLKFLLCPCPLEVLLLKTQVIYAVDT